MAQRHALRKARVIRRVVERIRRDYKPVQVILFGSYAYGRPTPDSDVDLLIIKETTKPFHRRLFDVRRVASPVLDGQPFEPIVITPNELRHRLERGDQFFHEIMTRGKRLYDVAG